MYRKELYPQIIPVRMTQQEYELLKVRSKGAGVSMARFLVQGALTAEQPSPEMLLLRDQAIFQVRRVGLNLNQILVCLRQDFGIGVTRYSELNKTLLSVAAAMNKLGVVWDERSVK